MQFPVSTSCPCNVGAHYRDSTLKNLDLDQIELVDDGVDLLIMLMEADDEQNLVI